MSLETQQPTAALSNCLDLECFAKTFELLADTTGGPGRIRALIHELAIRGRLAKDGNAAPATNAVTGALSEMPNHWTVCPLGDIAQVVRGITFPASAKEKLPGPRLVACLRTTNVQRSIEWDDLLYVSEDFVGRPEQWIANGDICISMANSYELVGKVAQVCSDRPRVTFGGFLGVIRPTQSVTSDFLAIFMRSSTVQAELRKGATQTTNIANISLGRLRPLQISIPPLAEQTRIVAKVNQLMALCDDLESRQTKKREIGTRLTKSALEALTTAESPAEFDAAWKRVVDNFDVLIDRAEKMPDVRATLLELALHGRLTTRGRADVGADSLLRAIDAYWAESARSQRAVSGSSGPAIDGSNPPRGWEKCNVGRILQISSGDALPSHAMTAGGTIPVYGGNGVTGHHDQANVSRASLVMGRVGFYCGCVHLTPDRAWVTDNAFVVSYPDECFDQRFLYWLLLRTGRVVRRDGGATAQPVISGKKLYPLLIWLPPLEEQRRIGARMDQLMKVCDDLEAKLRQAEDRSAKLVEAAVQELVA